ncbi:fuconate dehydratase [Streptomyces cocklensis]|jgi:L-fuconate dehydratase|uniref:L-fuconate dehydratase n=1 Tax=Actinacidiphila cocklensis TaxID=887465 RepID=A0A9W4GT42_9ACTN|nr:enolase C-terminal domain-like protein [Actinacidiphila cocklensis]MDD1059957.1 fuconate dehydratase [Actinacidiphila cocklensis]WSX72813.1 fuconate dehydratase [Streptomyces sp. NBC_00899]WSX81119.1 fuconate dehydratase [Streptomyces sp. NBC_00899]CAG6395916.1 L-fuconate dehydratase [Actinacidiphila cocklensis]
MAELIIAVETADVRFPTSLDLDGSDAMNPEPDYSGAYVTVRTSSGAAGYGLAFTVGRGNEVEVAAVQALAQLVVGLPVDEVLGDLGAFSRRLTGDSQLRWLGPEKGAIHMAAAAIVNAVWDLYGRREGKPVWRLLAELSPEQLVGLVDFRYLQDALTREEALDILRRAEPGRAERTERLMSEGFPAYTTTPGWLGYSDEKLVRLSRAAVAEGFTQIKLKVGADPDDDVRRLRLAREAVGPGIRIAVDANQAWGVQQAIEWMRQLAPYDPYWIEEPTSPDDILGHAAVRRAVAPIKVATGEHTHNQVMFKQLLQAGSLDILQMDASRTAGVTENVAILLLAAKFGVPVCPHAGGLGLCEMVQHLAMFDYVAVSGTQQDRVIEYVDHLHEHFTDPVRIRRGRYLAPTAPGLSAELRAQSAAAHRFPEGAVWKRKAA